MTIVNVALQQGWAWHRHNIHDVLDLIDAEGHTLAWIQPRPPYCDRGHYMVMVQCVPDLDEQDKFPRYYMDVETAKRETELFLAWRLHKERAYV